MLKTFHKMAGVLGLAAVLALGLAATASAQTTDPGQLAVEDATGQLTTLATFALPLILGVTVLLLIIGFGKKLIRKAG